VSSVIFKYPILKEEKGVFLITHSQYPIDKGILNKKILLCQYHNNKANNTITNGNVIGNRAFSIWRCDEISRYEGVIFR